MIVPHTNMPAVLVRARIIFPALILLFGSSASAASFVGYRTGELQTKVVTPVIAAANTVEATTQKVIAQAVDEHQKAVENARQTQNQGTSTSTSSVTSSVVININTSTINSGKISATKRSYQFIPTQTPPPPTNSTFTFSQNQNNQWTDFDAARKAQDEWWAGVQAKHQEFAEKSQKDFEAFGAKAQADFDNFRNQAQQNFSFPK